MKSSREALTSRGRMVDGAGYDETSPVAIELGCLEDRADGLSIGEHTERAVVGLEAASQSRAGSARVGHEVVARVSTSKTDRLDIHIRHGSVQLRW